MRQFIIIMAAACGCPGILPAQDMELGGLFYDILPEGEAQVCSAPEEMKYSGHIEIPSFIEVEGERLPVTSIADFAFMDCAGMTGIVFPETLRRIGERAFMSCTALESVTIPKNVGIVGERSFSGCSGLRELTFECEAAILGEGAFENTTSLPWVYIVGVPEVGKGTFANCTALEWVEIERGTDRIGAETFANCKSIRTIYAHSDWPPMITIDTFDTATELTAELKVIAGAEGRYGMAAYWNRFANISETTVFPVSTACVASPTLTAWGGKGMIHVDGDTGDVAVYGSNGILIGIFHMEEGRADIAVEPGVYMVAGTESEAGIKVEVR